MFSSTSRPPPPSGQPPPPYFVGRYYKRNLRPAVIFTTFIVAIWALIWSVDAFRDIERHRIAGFPELATFDIVLGVLFAAISAIGAFGIFAAVKSSIPLIRVLTWATIAGLIIALAAQVIDLVLHVINKDRLIRECTAEVTGLRVRVGGLFDGNVRTLDEREAAETCLSWWNRGIVQDVAWIICVFIIGLLFVSMSLSYYRQLLDPSSVRVAPSNIYRLEARYPAPAPAPGYNPYNPYPDYVPPYDPHRPPGYTQDGYTGPTGDNKDGPNIGYNVGTGGGQFAPPTGPPPGQRNDERDEGFDPAALQAAMRASEQAPNAPGRNH